MPTHHTARSRGRDIVADIADDGTAELTVDGEPVPVRVVDGRYAVAYLAPVDDLLEGARQYVARLG